MRIRNVILKQVQNLVPVPYLYTFYYIASSVNIVCRKYIELYMKSVCIHIAIYRENKKT